MFGATLFFLLLGVLTLLSALLELWSLCSLKSHYFQQATWLSSKASLSLTFITLCFQKMEDVQNNRKMHRTLPKDQTQLLSLQHDHKQKKKEPSKSSNAGLHPPSSSPSKEVMSWPGQHFGAL